VTRPSPPLRRIGSLRVRLFVAALVWLAIAIPLGGIALAVSFRTITAEDFDDRLQDLLLMLIGSAEVRPSGEIALARSFPDPRFDQVYSGWYWIVVSGDQTLRSRSLWDQPFPLEPRTASTQAIKRTFVDAAGADVRIVERTVELPGASHPATFAVTGNLEQLHAEVRSFDRLLWLSLIVLGAGLLLAVASQVAIGLRPLRAVAREIDRIRIGQQSHLSATGLREIDVLVEQINTLIDHDRKQLERSRGNAADLAHALKTPLAILRSSFQGPEHDEQRAQLDTVQRLIDRQLARAASAGPRPGLAAEVEPILRALIDGMGRMHAERRLELAYESAPGLRFAGDTEDLEEMLGNVLDNACKWARTRVRASAAVAGNELRITIDDDGPGMNDIESQRATERGLRFDEKTPGSGLGLAIVSDLTQMYGGRLEISRSPLGGTRVALQLPAT
jgi:signal transduction histidine kinase